MLALVLSIGRSAISRLVKVFCVNPAVVAKVWHLAKPLLAPAFSERDDSTIEATRDEVLAGVQLLWLAVRDGKLIAAATTALTLTPKRKICTVTSAGGLGSRLWDFMSTLEEHAQAERCEVIRVLGRRGWKHVLKGYSEPWIVIEKRLAK